jgi:hypothetical protein
VSWTVVLTASAQRDLRRLDRPVATHIFDALTRLDAEAYPAAALAELYRRRWQVETALAQLKTTMPMEVRHGKAVSGVLTELTGFAIVYNRVRLVMPPAATLRQTTVERMSSREALRWLSAPSTGMPLMALMVNPVRPSRVAPRVKERRPKSFPLMITPRQALRQQVVRQAVKASLHAIRPRAFSRPDPWRRFADIPWNATPIASTREAMSLWAVALE